MSRKIVWVVVCVVMWVLVGCATPQVHFSGPDCGGVLVSADRIVSAAHCFHARYGPFDVEYPDGGIGYARLEYADYVNDYAELAPLDDRGRAIEVYWPWYAVYESPENGDIALLFGDCELRVEDKAVLIFWGDMNVKNRTGVIREGVWPYWSTSGAVVCPGDSGHPLWDISGPARGEWKYYGVGSRYMTQDINYMFGKLSHPYGTAILSAKGER